MNSIIGVGIIGASATNPRWASATHVPAVQQLDRFALRAVATSKQTTADAAAAAFGAAAGYGDARALVEDPTVDLVVVAVKAPHHRELVLAALEAGKMVLCEWPLGVTLDEARELTERADAAGVRTVIGLQARYVPQLRHARQLIADGYIGRPMATTLVASGMTWGAVADPAFSYAFDAAHGVTPLSVTGMHALDAVAAVLSEPSELTARGAIGRPEVPIDGTAERLVVTTPDQISLSGVLTDGTLLSGHIRGGVSRGQNLHWEINGTEGDLVLSAPVNGNIQATDLTLSGARGGDSQVAPLDLPGAYAREAGAELPEPARSIAGLYSALARDLDEGTTTVPSFGTALRHHELLADLVAGRHVREGAAAAAA